MPADQPEWIRLACQEQGGRVRQARERASLSQEELAERAGLSRSTVQRVEWGVGIKFVHLLCISRALDVPLADLVR